MYTLLRETTKWADGSGSNFIYAFEGKPNKRLGNAVGYINHLSDEFRTFSKPMTIDMKDRTFVEVHNLKFELAPIH
jgi:hypothetical protein